MNGYDGTILRINLTDGTIHRHPTEEHLARTFLGGRGLNVKRLWDELPAHTDGLAPQNLLVFGVGPLVGTLFPGGARFNVSAMSPQTGILGDSNAGGFFGPELKFAGYDQVIIQGERDMPFDAVAYHHREWEYGRFKRVVTLPFHVEPDSLRAKLEDGTLEIRLAKR